MDIVKINELSSKNSNKTGVLKTLSGPFSFSKTTNEGKENGNSRLYSDSLLENKIVKSPYTKMLLETKTMFGTIDHPDNMELPSLKNASHCVTALSYKDGVVYGEVDVLDTPMGKVLESLLNYGSNLGISSRAGGTTKDAGKGKVEVDEDAYMFLTYDFVTIPGFPAARPKLVESISKVLEGMDTESLSQVSNVAQNKTEFASLLNESLNALQTISESKTKVTDPVKETRKESDETLNTLIQENQNLRAEIDSLKCELGKLQMNESSIEYIEVVKAQNTKIDELNLALNAKSSKLLVDSIDEGVTNVKNEARGIIESLTFNLAEANSLLLKACADLDTSKQKIAKLEAVVESQKDLTLDESYYIKDKKQDKVSFTGEVILESKEDSRLKNLLGKLL